MGNFNKYNERSLSQLLAESAEILNEDEFPPGGASTEPPPAASGELPPDESELEAGPPGEEEGGGEGEGGAEDTPEGIVNQLQDLLDQLKDKLGVGGGEEGEETSTSGELPGGSPENISAPASPPPVESRAKKPTSPAVARRRH